MNWARQTAVLRHENYIDSPRHTVYILAHRPEDKKAVEQAKTIADCLMVNIRFVSDSIRYHHGDYNEYQREVVESDIWTVEDSRNVLIPYLEPIWRPVVPCPICRLMNATSPRNTFCVLTKSTRTSMESQLLQWRHLLSSCTIDVNDVNLYILGCTWVTLSLSEERLNQHERCAKTHWQSLRQPNRGSLPTSLPTIKF